MRILMVNNFAYVTGGADHNCLGLATELTHRGHEVAFLSTASPANAVDQGIFIEARVTHHSRDRLGSRRQLDVAARAFWNPDGAQAMLRLLEGFRPQLVHAHKLYPQISVAPLVLAGRAHLPIVQTLHDYELLSASAIDHRGGRVDHDESKASYRALNTGTFPVRRLSHTPLVSAWITCSRFVADRYRTRGIEATVLPYFVEPLPRSPLAFSHRRGAIFVGRLHKEKGVLDVIRLAEVQPSTHVSVAGYGPLEEAVARAAGQLSNLEFLGRLDGPGVLAALERHKVMLMPSLWQEPGGIAALEAMSVGTPVIAYANGGLAQYVSDAGGGRVIDPSLQALAAACRSLHDDSASWAELSDRGVASVTRNHSRHGYVSAVEVIYDGVLRTRSGRSSPTGQCP